MTRYVQHLTAIAVAIGAAASAAGAQATSGTPAEGYNVHVLAPHLVDGHSSGPYHHYCKVVAGDPKIVCLIFDSTDPNAVLMQVEYIYAKSLVRPNTTRGAWNVRWHDHAVEIAGGRVQVLDLPPADAQNVANLVATTDGLIVHFYFDRNGLPTGRTSIAQAVGHRPLSGPAYNRARAEARRR